MPGIQCVGEVVLDQQSAPGAVDDADTGFRLCQRRLIEDVLGRVGQGGVKGDEVGPGEQLVQLDLLDPEFNGPLDREEGVEGDNLHAQAKGAIGSVSNAYGTLNLTSSAKGLVFFDLTGSQLVGINGLDFNVNSGATVVVNVTGPVSGAISNFGFQGDYTASKTLFNFVDATAVAIQNKTMNIQSRMRNGTM